MVLGLDGMSGMTRLLLRRIGMAMLAVALLGGGVLRMAPPAAHAAPIQVTTHDHHDGYRQPASDPTCTDCAAAHPGGAGCAYGADCAACAVVLPAGVQTLVVPRWSDPAFRSNSPRLSGVALQPDLFPPICRA